MSDLPNFPIREHLVIWQGMKFSKPFFLEKADGTWYDTTGYTARMHIRPSAGSATLTLECTTENGRLATGHSATVNGVAYTGGVLISIPATDTDDLEGGFVGGYDLEIIPPSGEADAEKLAYGRVVVNGEYSR